MTIGSDLFLDLFMYRVPQNTLSNIRRMFPNVSLIPVNSPKGHSIPADLEVYWGNRINADIVRQSPNLKWVHFGSVGTDHARIPEIAERKIIVTSSKGLVTAAMVTSCLAFMSSLARGFHHLSPLRAEGNLNRENYDRFYTQIFDLENQTILIAGAGEIGQRLASILKALRMRVIGIRRTPGALRDFDLVVSRDQIADVISEADYVVNLFPLNTSTKACFNLELFRKMKKDAFFINLGRGETVVEGDLIAALRHGDIAGAGLDVFESEPLAENSPLLALPNVIATPHVAALSQSYWPKQESLFLTNLRYYLEGNTAEMINLVPMAGGLNER